MLLRETSNPEILAAAGELKHHSQEINLYASLSVIISEDTGHVLVTHRKKDGQLGLPCGKADGGEVTQQTAYRELEEETGVKKTDLVDGLCYLNDINMDGCLVSVYTGHVHLDIPVGPKKGFEREGKASWMSPKAIAETPSRFQNFNIVAMFNAGAWEGE